MRLLSNELIKDANILCGMIPVLRLPSQVSKTNVHYLMFFTLTKATLSLSLCHLNPHQSGSDAVLVQRYFSYFLINF